MSDTDDDEFQSGMASAWTGPTGGLIVSPETAGPRTYAIERNCPHCGVRTRIELPVVNGIATLVIDEACPVCKR